MNFTLQWQTNFVFFSISEKIVRKFLLFSCAFLISLITVMSRTQRKPLEACTETFYWSFLRTFMRIWLFRLLALHMVWNCDLPQFCGFPSKKGRKKTSLQDNSFRGKVSLCLPDNASVIKWRCLKVKGS